MASIQEQHALLRSLATSVIESVKQNPNLRETVQGMDLFTKYSQLISTLLASAIANNKEEEFAQVLQISELESILEFFDQNNKKSETQIIILQLFGYINSSEMAFKLLSGLLLRFLPNMASSVFASWFMSHPAVYERNPELLRSLFKAAERSAIVIPILGTLMPMYSKVRDIVKPFLPFLIQAFNQNLKVEEYNMPLRPTILQVFWKIASTNPEDCFPYLDDILDEMKNVQYQTQIFDLMQQCAKVDANVVLPYVERLLIQMETYSNAVVLISNILFMVIAEADISTKKRVQLLQRIMDTLLNEELLHKMTKGDLFLLYAVRRVCEKKPFLISLLKNKPSIFAMLTSYADSNELAIREHSSKILQAAKEDEENLVKVKFCIDPNANTAPLQDLESSTARKSFQCVISQKMTLEDVVAMLEEEIVVDRSLSDSNPSDSMSSTTSSVKRKKPTEGILLIFEDDEDRITLHSNSELEYAIDCYKAKEDTNAELELFIGSEDANISLSFDNSEHEAAMEKYYVKCAVYYTKGEQILKANHVRTTKAIDLRTGEFLICKEILLKNPLKEEDLNALAVQIEVALNSTRKDALLVPLLGAQLTAKSVVFVEQCMASNLRNMIARFGSLGKAVCQKFLQQLVKALLLLQQENFEETARLNLDNVLVTRSNTVALSDYGIVGRVKQLLQVPKQTAESISPVKLVKQALTLMATGSANGNLLTSSAATPAMIEFCALCDCQGTTLQQLVDHAYIAA